VSPKGIIAIGKGIRDIRAVARKITDYIQRSSDSILNSSENPAQYESREVDCTQDTVIDYSFFRIVGTIIEERESETHYLKRSML
jgi:hypothetical protein